MKAKKPFLFFRWCIEFKLFREAFEKNESYYSSYPIYIDASANALQHISAMGRISEFADFLNLTGTPKEEVVKVNFHKEDINLT